MPVSEKAAKQKTGPKVGRGLSVKVNDFYNSDGVSWQAPGRKCANVVGSATGPYKSTWVFDKIY
mgnify:CR=1 FL=1